MAKYKLSLTAEEIDARLNKIPNAWKDIADQSYNGLSENAQSGKAVAEGITSIQNLLTQQVDQLKVNIEDINSSLTKIDYNNLENKPCFMSSSIVCDKTIIPEQEYLFEFNADANISMAIFALGEPGSPLAPIVPGFNYSITIGQNEPVSVGCQQINPDLTSGEIIYAIGNLSLIDPIFPNTLENFVAYYMLESCALVLGISGSVVNPLKVGLFQAQEDNIPIVRLNQTDFFEEDIFGTGNLHCFMMPVMNITKDDLYTLTFNDNPSMTELSWSDGTAFAPSGLSDTCYYIGNLSITGWDKARNTGEDFLILFILAEHIGPMSVGELCFVSKISLSQLLFEKKGILTKDIHKLSDEFLAYTEGSEGEVIFDGDVIIDKTTSLRQFSKEVQDSPKLIKGLNISNDPTGAGISINQRAIPTACYAWIEPGASEPIEIFNSSSLGYYISPEDAYIEANSSELVIIFSSPSTATDALDRKLHNCVLFAFASTEAPNKIYYMLNVGATAVDNTIRVPLINIPEDYKYNDNLYVPTEANLAVCNLFAYKSNGDYSHAEGNNTTASGSHSHAEGNETTASSTNSHAEGDNTVAKGYSSHTEGYQTTASGSHSHAEGNETTASGYNSHAEGDTTVASAQNAHAEGNETTASGIASHSENSFTVASGHSSHAEGNSTVASGGSSHAEGDNTVAKGDDSHAEGYYTTADYRSHTEGYETTASNYSHAEGFSATASNYSHAEGYHTTSDDHSHAEGVYSEAVGSSSHVEGYYTKTSTEGKYAHAEGCYSEANGEATHAEGYYTIANSNYSHVQGKYNIPDPDGTYAHILGNGSNEAARSNAHTIDWAGNAWFSGNLSAKSFINESGDALGISTSNYIILTDADSKLDYLIQMKGGQLVTTLAPISVSISKLPTKTVYFQGEYIDTTGIEFTVTYPDGRTEVIEHCGISCSPDPLMDVGDVMISVKAKVPIPLETTFAVIVEEFDPETVLVDFDYLSNDDGTYTLSSWKQTLQGVPSTELYIPNNALIKL